MPTPSSPKKVWTKPVLRRITLPPDQMYRLFDLPPMTREVVAPKP